MSEPCAFEWWAPRADVLDSPNVHHVCDLGRDHSSPWHHCPCGRNVLGPDDG